MNLPSVPPSVSSQFLLTDSHFFQPRGNILIPDWTASIGNNKSSLDCWRAEFKESDTASQSQVFSVKVGGASCSWCGKWAELEGL